MRVAMGLICLNEEEFLWDFYTQHCGWPSLVRMVLVHGADRLYGTANPSMVTGDGFSIDRTAEILQEIAAIDSRVTVIRHGWMHHVKPDQGKCDGRNRYLEVMEAERPDIVVTQDADEFVTRADQQAINDKVARIPELNAFRFAQRHAWRPASIAHLPYFTYEVVNGYWKVPHCRVWRWKPGMRHRDDHNTPRDGHGALLTDRLYVGDHGDPEVIHLGFARSAVNRLATNKFYEARGEVVSRPKHVECRRAFADWQPGQKLPQGAKVIPWTGPVPEVFREVAAA